MLIVANIRPLPGSGTATNVTVNVEPEAKRSLVFPKLKPSSKTKSNDVPPANKPERITFSPRSLTVVV